MHREPGAACSVCKGWVAGLCGWAPNIDCDLFPMQLDKAFASGMSKDGPLLIGSTLNETDYYFRALAVLEAKSKSSAKGGAPVYRYELDYLSPAQNSLFRCPLNMEIPFRETS